MTTTGALSNYAEAAVLNNFFKKSAYTPQVNTYLALYTSNPTDSDVGNEVSTIGTSYSRMPITWGAPALVDGKFEIKNSADITFAKATADWGLVTHFGIRDAQTAGNLLAYGAVEVAADVTAGNEYVVLGTKLIVRLTGDSYSRFLAEAVLNMFFRNTAVAPTDVYASLYITDPTVENTGTEVSTGSYARQMISFGAITQDANGRSIIKNSAAIVFPVATAQYGPVTYVGICNALTGGNLFCFRPASKSVTIQPSQQYKVDINSMTLTIE